MIRLPFKSPIDRPPTIGGVLLIGLAIGVGGCGDDGTETPVEESGASSSATTETESTGGPTSDGEASGSGSTDEAGSDSTTGAPAECDADDDATIAVPNGFCVKVFAEGLGRARHLTVTPSGDVFVAIDNNPGHVAALRDVDGDRVADTIETFGGQAGNGIAWSDGALYVAIDDRIERYAVADGSLTPTSADPEVIVSGLPANADHAAKSVVVTDTGALLVNIGSASNSCQENNRVAGSPGVDPCPELTERAGIWAFDGQTIGQVADEPFATGIRNGNAIDIHPQTGVLWTAQNGRDQLFAHWSDHYTAEDDARLPGEEIFAVEQAHDYGWPYCYYDPDLDQKVLAPEYGGNGTLVASNGHDCAAVDAPDTSLPAHWAPLGLHFYRGDRFPARYHHGMFVASHGSRFEPQAEEPPGYNVVFIPFNEGSPSGPWEPFATGFAGPGRPLPDEANARPVGLAESPDGALYVSDDKSGRIWMIYRP